MTRRALVVLSLLGLAACSGEPSQPSEPAGGPAFEIVDASDPGGRPDFGWRPPIGNTSLAGTFDGTRAPTVRICVLDVSNNTCTGTELLPTSVPVVNSNYQYDWMVPVSPVTHYRIIIEAGTPAIILGYADVRTAATSKELKGNDPNQFVGVTDGSILPIKFRITDACDNANCGDGSIDTQQGGTVYYTEDGETKGGITIPPTPGGGVVTVEITPCTGNLPIPNPKFGSCLDVDVTEGGNEYDGVGVAFICDALQAATNAGLNAAERDEVTLYRKHGTDPVEALPHADDDCPAPVLGDRSVKGLLRALVHGNWKKAGQELVGLVAPKPLYARRLDAGAGGSVDGGFSLFQFAQPCVAGVGNNSGNFAADAAYSSGDLDGAICRISEATFNGFVPSELRDLFPALIITWDSDPSLNADWATRLLPYLNLGGGVLFDGDTKNISDLAAIVTASDTTTGGEFGTFTVSATVAGLTDAINGSFENNHIRFDPSWDSNLAPFLSFSPDGETSYTVGLYGTFGTGCIVLTGPDQDFHGLRASTDPEEINQYNLLLNEIRFVQGGGNCVAPAPPILTNRARSSEPTRVFTPQSNRPVVKNLQVPPQQKTVRRPTD
jgi:hypothetical protein